MPLSGSSADPALRLCILSPVVLNRRFDSTRIRSGAECLQAQAGEGKGTKHTLGRALGGTPGALVQRAAPCWAAAQRCEPGAPRGCVPPGELFRRQPGSSERNDPLLPARKKNLSRLHWQPGRMGTGECHNSILAPIIFICIPC